MIEPHELVEARLYATEQDGMHDALRSLLRTRPDLRIQIAIHRYLNEDISVAKAASLAGVRWAQMKDILHDHAIQPRLGPQTGDDVQHEAESLRAYCANQQ